MKYSTLVLWFCTAPCLADVRLPKVFGSNMVLQRNSDVTIWGWAEGEEEVVIHCGWLDTTLRATPDGSGKWQVQVQTGEAGGPHSITIAGQNTIRLEQILFGEVWIASGQSNMEMPLVSVSGAYTGIENAQHEVENSDFPNIRLFQVNNFSSKEPLDDLEHGISMYGVPLAPLEWQACRSETIPTFASTAYFFARELHQQLRVPIGIVDASWGGTSAEAWTPAAGLEALGYATALEQANTLPQKADQKIPTRLYNGMIHPLRRCKIRGAIWYQGEGNAARAAEYYQLFSTMIGQWRKSFGSEFPFYFVQISPFHYRDVNAAFLREAQLQTLSVPQTGMVVTMDIGNLDDIHPKNKQEVGRRLALWALAKEYGHDVVFSGPIYKSVVFEGAKARLQFAYAGGGLATRDGMPPSHFEIAGPDKIFRPAIASIVGNDQLVVSATNVAQPVAVRYAFNSIATPNLMNREGLPASPFRTDTW